MVSVGRYLSFLAALGFTVACFAAQVKLGNGALLNIDLKEAKLVAELSSDTGHKFALIAGRDCTECDENTSLYVAEVQNSGAPVVISNKRNLYPGSLHDYESGEIIQRTRTFFGRCLNVSGDSIVWFVDFKGGDKAWVKAEDALSWVNNAEQHQLSKTSQPDFTTVLAAVTKGLCHEIPGKDQNSEP